MSEGHRRKLVPSISGFSFPFSLPPFSSPFPLFFLLPTFPSVPLFSAPFHSPETSHGQSRTSTARSVDYESNKRFIGGLISMKFNLPVI